MNETKKTLIFCAAAVVLALLVVFTTPKKITPDAFLDQDELFFPDFEDPNEARTLEVIEYDEESGAAKPFKVTFADGKWSIPSHYDYPADGKDRLAQTAAGVIGIKKDDFRTDNAADHGACGVIDPLDETVVALQGRGKRVTIKGDNDVVLADFIVGKPSEGRENFRLVRVPGQKRVYGARVNLDISTKFSDWIEADLLKVEKDDIEHVILKDYSVDERSRKLDKRDEIFLKKQGEDWTADGLSDDQQVDKYKMGNLLKALDELTIVGVRTKPEGLTASLQKAGENLTINTSDLLALQSKGYFFASDGRLLSNEGELQARTSQGVIYTLRFGEIVYGSGMAVSAGSGGSESGQGQPGENRYLFITTEFTALNFPEPAKPANTDFLDKPDSLWTSEDHQMKSIQLAHDEWKNKIEGGRALSDELNARFARWYYVISSESFDKLRLKRSDLVKDKPKNN
jgi:hypothetical protein